MKQNLPTRRMREQPDLEQLKRQAKELLQRFAAGHAGAAAEVNAQYHAANPSTFALHDAQLVLARSYGFESWPKLKAYVDGVTIKRLGRRRASGRSGAGANDASSAAGACRFDDVVRRRASAHPLRRDETIAGDGATADAARRECAEGIHPHRDATTAWTIAQERGYEEIVAIIDEEEQRRGEQTTVPNADGNG